MSAEALLAKLDKVKATGSGRWLACCPSHDDKHPSLVISELDDGRVLAHCFAGCAITDIINTAGLEFDCLFPPRAITGRVKPLRKSFHAADVLEAISTEALICVIAAADMARGRCLDPKERERLNLASARIQAARELANG